MPTSKIKICVPTKVGTLLLPSGRLSYPHLFIPKAVTDEPGGEKKYSTAIMLPPDVDLSLAVQMVEAAANERWGKEAASGKRIKKPFLKHAEKTEDQELAAQFPYLIRCSSKNRPQIMFANGAFCTDDEEVYPGRWARISVRAYAWEHQTGGRGVSFGLSNVQILDHDERIGGGRVNAEDEFDPVEIAGNGASGGANPDKLFD